MLEKSIGACLFNISQHMTHTHQSGHCFVVLNNHYRRDPVTLKCLEMALQFNSTQKVQRIWCPLGNSPTQPPATWVLMNLVVFSHHISSSLPEAPVCRPRVVLAIFGGLGWVDNAGLHERLGTRCGVLSCADIQGRKQSEPAGSLS